MSREWQPGDVAMLTVREFDGTKHLVGLCYKGGEVDAGDIKDMARWTLADHSDAWSSVTEARPLVVIDPVSITGPDETGEDGDPLVEIASCLRRLAEGDAWEGSYRRRVAERLAEVFDPSPPPKPAEPLGLGAVVESAEGLRWTRAGSSAIYGNWLGTGSKTCVHYAAVPAVRVLSEGVQ